LSRTLSAWTRRPGLILKLLLLMAFAGPCWGQAPDLESHTVELPDAPEVSAQAQAQVGATQRAEEQRGSIHGLIVDHDGAVYEGVHVTLTQTSRPDATEETTTSDSDGRFTFSGVLSGPVRLTVSSNGFATKIVIGVLKAGEDLDTGSIVLSFARTTTEVQVTASRAEIATEELHAEEQQHVLGFIPNFYVVYAPNAPPLSSRQKFHLAWKSSIDPFNFLITGVSAGIEQASDEFGGYGQGAQGYAKRYGANYADGFIGNMIGGAILPSLFKQDPRYFYKGTGTVKSRALYAIANAVICKGDNGHWQFNYSGILGSLASGGISNLYYPDSDRNGVSLTFENTLIGIGGSAVGNLFQEFLVRKLTPHVPNYSSKP
jgi:uncharacterized membrane protein YeaQ/YmgE (transglycosylase-associated protein family)